MVKFWIREDTLAVRLLQSLDTYTSNNSFSSDAIGIPCDVIRRFWNDVTSSQQLFFKHAYVLSVQNRTHGFDWLTPWSCGQSYKASTIVIYDSRVVPDLKIPHITTLKL